MENQPAMLSVNLTIAEANQIIELIEQSEEMNYFTFGKDYLDTAYNKIFEEMSLVEGY